MEKQCLNCDLFFTPNSGKQKFCSDKCKVAYARKKVKEIEGVTTADKVPVPPAKPFKEGGTMLEEIQLDAKKDKWVILVENFCNVEGITPAELIEGYKLSKSYKKAVMNKKEGNEIILQDFTKENAVGKPYNPENNWLYRSKMAKQGKPNG